MIHLKTNKKNPTPWMLEGNALGCIEESRMQLEDGNSRGYGSAETGGEGEPYAVQRKRADHRGPWKEYNYRFDKV